MTTLHIEHPIHDFSTWKAAFDRDPAGRERSEARGYRILRPTDDPHYVIIHLDFDSAGAAAAFLDVMRAIWRSPEAAPALAGGPQTRIAEPVESVEY